MGMYTSIFIHPTRVDIDIYTSISYTPPAPYLERPEMDKHPRSAPPRGRATSASFGTRRVLGARRVAGVYGPNLRRRSICYRGPSGSTSRFLPLGVFVYRFRL